MEDKLWRNGTAEEVKQVDDSITGQYLSGRKQIAVPKKRRKHTKTKVIEVQEASENNLKNISYCACVYLHTRMVCIYVCVVYISVCTCVHGLCVHGV